MVKQLFLNLHVADLGKARQFYTQLGFTVNEQFSDDTACCIVVSETICVMLLTHDKFREFSTKEIADAKKSTEVMIALSVDSRERVDKLVDAALAHGGTPGRPPQDHGFMYGRAFNDPDGHVWEVFWMN